MMKFSMGALTSFLFLLAPGTLLAFPVGFIQGGAFVLDCKGGGLYGNKDISCSVLQSEPFVSQVGAAGTLLAAETVYVSGGPSGYDYGLTVSVTRWNFETLNLTTFDATWDPEKGIHIPSRPIVRASGDALPLDDEQTLLYAEPAFQPNLGDEEVECGDWRSVLYVARRGLPEDAKMKAHVDKALKDLQGVGERRCSVIGN